MDALFLAKVFVVTVVLLQGQCPHVEALGYNNMEDSGYFTAAFIHSFLGDTDCIPDVVTIDIGYYPRIMGGAAPDWDLLRDKLKLMGSTKLYNVEIFVHYLAYFTLIRQVERNGNDAVCPKHTLQSAMDPMDMDASMIKDIIVLVNVKGMGKLMNFIMRDTVFCCMKTVFGASYDVYNTGQRMALASCKHTALASCRHTESFNF